MSANITTFHPSPKKQRCQLDTIMVIKPETRGKCALLTITKRSGYNTIYPRIVLLLESTVTNTILKY